MRESATQSIVITVNDKENETSWQIIEDRILDLKIQRDSTNGSTFEVGNMTAADLTVTLENYDGYFNNCTFEGANLNVVVKIKREDGTVYSIPQGLFIVDNAPRKQKTITLMAMDSLVLLDQPFKNNFSVQKTISLASLARDCILQCSLNCKDLERYIPDTVNVSSSFDYSNSTCRNILIHICQCCGINAYADLTGTIVFYFVNDLADFTLDDKEDCFDSDTYENDTVLAGAIFTAKSDEDDTTSANAAAASYAVQNVSVQNVGIKNIASFNYLYDSDNFKGSAQGGYAATDGIQKDTAKLYASVNGKSYNKMEWSGTEIFTLSDGSTGQQPIILSSAETPWQQYPYFDIQFSAKDYTNITFRTEIGATNKGAADYAVMYSVNGNDFKYLYSENPVDEYDYLYCLIKSSENKLMKNAFNALLPSECDNAENVTVRVIVDSDYTVEGGETLFTTTNASGKIAINNIFIAGVYTGEESDDSDELKEPVIETVKTSLLKEDVVSIVDSNLSKTTVYYRLTDKQGNRSDVFTYSQPFTLYSLLFARMASNSEIKVTTWCETDAKKSAEVSRTYSLSFRFTKGKVDDSESYSIGNTEKGYVFEICGNPIFQGMDETNRRNILSVFYRRVLGFHFRPFECTCISFPHVFAGDVITLISNGIPHNTVITSSTYEMNKNSYFISSGQTAVESGYAKLGGLTAHQKLLISDISRKDISFVDNAVLNLNNAISNSLGLFSTTITADDGSRKIYYHDSDPIENSGYIFTMNSGGFAWTTSGWNNGSPKWHGGIDNNSNAVLNYLTANAISAKCLRLLNDNNQLVFYADGSGDLTLTGCINANTGQIGGFNISATKIYGGDASTGVAVMQLPQANTTYVFAAGGTSHNSYADCPFRVTKAGKLYATNAEISGKIAADSGTIGAWEITDAYLRSTGSSNRVYIRPIDSNGGSTKVFQIQNNGSGSFSDKYYVTANGDMRCDGSFEFNGTLKTTGSWITCSTEMCCDGFRLRSNPNNESIRIDGTTPGTGSYGNRFHINSIHGIHIESVGYAVNLEGSSIHLWNNTTCHGTLYNSSGGAITSDERLKNSIQPLADDPRYEAFFNLLEGVSFKYNDGTSGRTHMGMIAQKVKQALEKAGFTTQEIGAFVECQMTEEDGVTTDDGKVCSLRYEEFVTLNTAMIQKQAKIIQEQQKRMDAFEKRLETLEKKQA